MVAAPAEPKRRRILFVDDDAAVLAGLEHALQRDRSRWEMVFAVGGQRALYEIRQTSFDAVISDMRMPHVDGGTLLTIVRQENAAAARILLTGQVDDADLDRLRPVLHEVLRKPCRTADLRDAIDRNMVRLSDERAAAAVTRRIRRP